MTNVADGTDIDLVPNIDEFRPYVLRALSDGEVWHLRDLRLKVADLIGLSAEAMEQTIPSGQARYKAAWVGERA